MAKKAKKKIAKKKIVLWRWIIILIPLIIAIVWVITLISTYKEIPLIYEQASPTGILTLLSLIFVFIVSYGAFVFMEFKRNMEEI